MSDPILLERDGSIATVILNNPDKRNALTFEAWGQLGEVMEELDHDDALRCIVVRGAGTEAFAAGADISEFETRRSTADQAAAYGEVVSHTIKTILENRHPTLAVVRGACTGGGLEIACACDIRISGESGKFGVPINRLGHVLFYPELDLLLRLAGPATTAELLLEGRILGAAEAQARGLVNRLVADADLDEEAAAAASRIAKGAPLAARLHKRLIRRLADPARISPHEMEECAAICDSEDYRNGFRAFLNKEKPVFNAR